MIVQFRTHNIAYPDLTPNQHYVVIGIEADDFRILNDSGRPFLYDDSLFEVVDSTEPDDWVTEIGEDGERYAYPLPLNAVGFFEDFFDGEKKAIVAFWQVVNHQLAAASGTA
ncbi:MAG: hypothetical protein F4X75_02940 [Gemmatimonadetes bacterium]|nr:hypothetical protein [Gemmatimonadota bacterium]